MRLNLKTIFTDVSHGDRSPVFFHELDFSSVRLWGERPFSRPVRVSGYVTRRSEVYTIRYEADFETRAQCSRCLVAVERTYHKEFEHVLLEDVRDGDTIGDFIPAPGGELDLDELVTSDILLELDGVPLCSEDCHGLCPKCGKNLNEGGCGCDLREPDPRFDVLRKLLEE